MIPFYLKRLLILCFVITSSLAYAQKSHVYKSKKTQMRVKFPCNYTSSVTEKDKYTTYKMTCKDLDITYLATATIHRLKMKNLKGLITISLDAFTNSFKGATVIYTKDWKVGKKKGTMRQLLYKNNLLNYYVIMHKNKQIQLIVLGPKDKFSESSRDTFVNSFKLL